MLFLPFLDILWIKIQLIQCRMNNAPSSTPLLEKSRYFKKHLPSIVIALTGLATLAANPDYKTYALATLLLTALPEEWFFRAYFMTHLETFFKSNRSTLQLALIKTLQSRPELSANGLTSALFALLHTPTQGWFGLTIFFPSLFFGWVYQKTGDLILVILLHTLLNIIFIVYLSHFIY